MPASQLGEDGGQRLDVLDRGGDLLPLALRVDRGAHSLSQRATGRHLAAGRHLVERGQDALRPALEP